MISLSSKAILFSSLAVSGAAALGVASLYFGGQPQSPGVDPAQVRQAALRLEQAQLSAGGGIAPLGFESAAHYAASPFQSNAGAQPAGATEPVVVLTAQPAETGGESATAAPAPPESPVKDLALMGVTRQSGDERAWLIDVNNNERETVGEGGTAWGFTVRDIEPESVVLTRGDEQWTLRLGEREIPGAQTTLASEAGGAPGEGEPQFGRGRREGGEDAERDQRREMFRRMMEGRGGFMASSGRPGGFEMGGFRGSFSPSSSSFGRPSFGGSSGNSWRGSSSESARPRMEFRTSSSPWRGGSSSGSSGSFWRGGSSSSGRSWGGGSSSSSRFSNSGRSTSATSNPQTQRRQQAASGGAAGPQPIVNPQTQRRTGGSAASRSSNSRSSGSRFGGSSFGGSDRGTSTFSSSR